MLQLAALLANVACTRRGIEGVARAPRALLYVRPQVMLGVRQCRNARSNGAIMRTASGVASNPAPVVLGLALLLSACKPSSTKACDAVGLSLDRRNACLARAAQFHDSLALMRVMLPAQLARSDSLFGMMYSLYKASAETGLPENQRLSTVVVAAMLFGNQDTSDYVARVQMAELYREAFALIERAHSARAATHWLYSRNFFGDQFTTTDTAHAEIAERSDTTARAYLALGIRRGGQPSTRRMVLTWFKVGGDWYVAP